MANTMYAWSRILYGVEKDDEGNVLGPKAIEIGDSVSQSDLDMSDEDWQNLVDQQVVRDVEMPDYLKDPFRSPRQIMQDRLTEAQEGFDRSGPTADLLRRFDDEGEVVQPEEINPETGKTTPAPQAPPPASQ
ncbi:MAG TPA: hypothetical protein VGE97_09280 [Nitrososphaera sp.]|jgi:hypothetical protein